MVNTFLFSFCLVLILTWTENLLLLRRRSFFLVFTYFRIEKGCQHEIPRRVLPSVATPLPSLHSCEFESEFWQLSLLHVMEQTTAFFALIWLLGASSVTKMTKHLAVCCDYVAFTNLPWPGDREGSFRSASQTAICMPHMVRASRSPFNC